MNPSQPWTKTAQRTYSDWLFWLRIRSYPYSPCYKSFLIKSAFTHVASIYANSLEQKKVFT